MSAANDWPPERRSRRGYHGAVRADALPWLDVDAVREIDRFRVEELGALGVPHSTGDAVGDSDLVIDAILGYSQRGAPYGLAAELIRKTHGRRTISLDVPSGLELATGTLHEPDVRAAATMTLAAPKEGLRAAPDAVATLFVADISVPEIAYRRLGIGYTTPFAGSAIVRIVD